MKAGRELDARIDAEIFGVERKLCTIHHAYSCCGRTTKHYSTQIADADLVLKNLTGDGWRFRLTYNQKRPNGELPYRASFCKWGTKSYKAYSDALEHAICLAALAVVERRG